MNFKKVTEWGKVASSTAVIQMVVQLIGFISGVLIIRMLSIEEYALYTLSNTMLVSMTSLADGGISSGVLSQGGKVWQDRQKLGVIFATGMALRRKFACVSLVVSTPVLYFLLLKHEASWGMATIIVLALVPTFFALLSGSLLEIIPKLKQEIFSLQKIQLGVSLGRLSLTGISLLSFPFAFVAVLGSGIPQIWANFEFRRLAKKNISLKHKPDPTRKIEILAMVKRILPDSIYHSISGYFPIWLITIYGATAAVAQVGVLSRLVMVVMPISLLLGILVLPRFARLPDDSKLLLKRYLQIQMFLLIFVIFLLTISFLFSAEILIIFGDDYHNMDSEVVLAMVGNCLGLVSGASFQMCISRGWVISPLISISINFIAVILGVFIFEVSTLHGVFVLYAFVNLIMAVLHISYSFFRLSRLM